MAEQEFRKLMAAAQEVGADVFATAKEIASGFFLIPHLTRSSLHRVFQRHAIGCLATADDTRPRLKFKAYPLGYFHVDLAEVGTEEGTLYLFVAIDPMPLTWPAPNTASTIASRHSTIRGPTAKSNA